MTSLLQQPDADSYYLASRNPAPAYPKLTGSHDTDVCVVGGGLSGCATALRLRELGYRVCLLEAGDIGWGASGRSGGQLIFGYACAPSRLERLVGTAQAQLLWRFAIDAMSLVERNIERYGIACDLTRGHLHAAVSTAQSEALQRWAEELGSIYDYSSVEFVTGAALRAHVDSARYRGGLFDSRGGHLHPLNYTLGLAAAAAAAGAQIFTRSPALDYTPGPRLRVRCAAGEVRCAALALCTNAYGDDLLGDAARYRVAVGSYIVATEPLAPALARTLLPGNVAVADMQHIIDYYRLSADRRLLFGSRVGVRALDRPGLVRAMRSRIARVFPALAATRIDYAWGGHIAVTRNRMPCFGRLGANVYYVNGYSAQGMVLSSLAGAVLAEAIAGDNERFDVFARVHHGRIPGPRALHPALVVAALCYHRLRDALG